MNGGDENQGDVEAWLEALGGRNDDPDASRLRQLLMSRQRRYEAGIDEVSLRREREKLLDAVAELPAETGYDRMRVIGLAASVAMVMVAGSVFMVSDPDVVDGDETVRSLDSLDVEPGDAINLTIDVADPSATADVLSQRLSNAQFAVERQVAGDVVVLTIRAAGDEDVSRLANSLRDLEVPPVVFVGTYRITIR